MSEQAVAELRMLIEEAQRTKPGGPGAWGRLPASEDLIFVSGAFPRPLVSRRQKEAAYQAQIEERRRTRKHETTTFDVARIVVAAAGDMAYEFGSYHIRWDNLAGGRTGLDGAYVRVWRKLDGHWCVEVSFQCRDRDQPASGAPMS